MPTAPFLGGLLHGDRAGGEYAVQLPAPECGRRTGEELPDLGHGLQRGSSGLRHCDERGCLRDTLGVPSGERHELCRGLHAEQNAIIQAAYHGVPISGAELYCTHQPCALCAKMLVNADVVTVYYAGDYPDPLAMEVFEEAGTRLVCKRAIERP